ncbi:hypothetical protein Y1Q_0004561 [Alligator mississippiensis]|uniref:Uncharacterized protein n=1 Tax=Alligator mississippiensis TaxID=8496 RepID=A0A151MHE8_ALLMI|nr:hypothetical protein Y1Q_0004561 [Alligator mississippiensis]
MVVGPLERQLISGGGTRDSGFLVGCDLPDNSLTSALHKCYLLFRTLAFCKSIVCIPRRKTDPSLNRLVFSGPPCPAFFSARNSGRDLCKKKACLLVGYEVEVWMIPEVKQGYFMQIILLSYTQHAAPELTRSTYLQGA